MLVVRLDFGRVERWVSVVKERTELVGRRGKVEGGR